MKSRSSSRLTLFDKLAFQRAKETFPAQSGTCSEDDGAFLLSILEVSTNVECGTIQQAINLARSWCELGTILPQNLMN
jgi:hypothetical protein